MEAILNFDLSVFEFFFNYLHNGVMDVIMKFITTLGDDGIFFIAVSLVMLCFKKTRKAGVVALGALLVMTILNNEIIKPIMERPRPYNLTRLSDAAQDIVAYTNGGKSYDWIGFFGKIDWNMSRFSGFNEKWDSIYYFPEVVERLKPTSLSFPSGHTSSAFTFALATTLVLKNKGVSIASFIFAFLMGISRIYVAVHYPTDVIVGAFVGLLYAVIGYFIFAKLYDIVYPKIEAMIEKIKSKKAA